MLIIYTETYLNLFCLLFNKIYVQWILNIKIERDSSKHNLSYIIKIVKIKITQLYN